MHSVFLKNSKLQYTQIKGTEFVNPVLIIPVTSHIFDNSVRLVSEMYLKMLSNLRKPEVFRRPLIKLCGTV